MNTQNTQYNILAAITPVIEALEQLGVEYLLAVLSPAQFTVYYEQPLMLISLLIYGKLMLIF